MNKSTVKVDLSDFFTDARKKTLLMVNPQWISVACLQKRVETLFHLDAVRFLDNEGCFIPPQECIEVIKYCASLKAFVFNEDVPKKKKKMKPSKIMKLCEFEENDSVKEIEGDFDLKVDNRKRKYRSLEKGFVNSTPNEAKRVKNDVLPTYMRHLPLEHKPSEISSTSEQLTPSSPHSETKIKQTKPRLTQHRGSSQDKVINKNKNEVELIGHNESKRDLVESATAQYQNNFTAMNNGVTNCGETHLEASPTSLPSSTLISKSKKQKKKPKSINKENPFKDSNQKSNHMYFDEAGDTITTTVTTICSPDIQNSEANDLILLHSTLIDVDAKKPRIFPIKKQYKDSKPAGKECIEIQENILLKPNYEPTPLGENDNYQPTPLGSITKDSEKSSLSTLGEKKDNNVDESNLNIEEAKNITEEGTDCSTNSSKMINTTTNKPTQNSAEVSHLIGDEFSNLNISGTNGDKVSSSQTAQNESNENDDKSKLNGSSIAVVDCVDLSVDLNDGDVSNISSNINKSKPTHDESNYDSSDVEEVSEVIDLNDSEEPKRHSRRIELKTSTIKLSQIMGLCKNMAQLPEIADIVVFKVSYKLSNGNSSSTQFIAGKVTNINRRTKLIKLLILDGLSELYKVPSKYHTFLDDSMCDEKYLQLKATDMIEPKVFCKNSSLC